MPRSARSVSLSALSIVFVCGQTAPTEPSSGPGDSLANGAPCQLPRVTGAATCGDGSELAHGEVCVPTCAGGSVPSSGNVGLLCDNTTLSPGVAFSCAQAAPAPAPSPPPAPAVTPWVLSVSMLCSVSDAAFVDDPQSNAVLETALAAILPRVDDDMVEVRGITHLPALPQEVNVNISIVVEARTPDHLIQLADLTGRMSRSTLTTYVNGGFASAGLPYDATVLDISVGTVPDICMPNDCDDPLFVDKTSPPDQCAGESCAQSECCDPLGVCDPEDCQVAGGYFPKSLENMPEHCAAAVCHRTECCDVLGICWSDVCRRGLVLKENRTLLCIETVCTSEECCEAPPAPYGTCSCGEGFILADEFWWNQTNQTNTMNATDDNSMDENWNCSAGLIPGPGCTTNHCCMPASREERPGGVVQDKEGMSGGAIAGIVIVCILVPCACAALLLYVQNRRRKRAAEMQGSTDTSEPWDEKQGFSSAFDEQPVNVIAAEQLEATVARLEALEATAARLSVMPAFTNALSCAAPGDGSEFTAAPSIISTFTASPSIAPSPSKGARVGPLPSIPDKAQCTRCGGSGQVGLLGPSGMGIMKKECPVCKGTGQRGTGEQVDDLDNFTAELKGMREEVERLRSLEPMKSTNLKPPASPEKLPPPEVQIDRDTGQVSRACGFLSCSTSPGASRVCNPCGASPPAARIGAARPYL